MSLLPGDGGRESGENSSAYRAGATVLSRFRSLGPGIGKQ